MENTKTFRKCKYSKQTGTTIYADGRGVNRSLERNGRAFCSFHRNTPTLTLWQMDNIYCGVFLTSLHDPCYQACHTSFDFRVTMRDVISREYSRADGQNDVKNQIVSRCVICFKFLMYPVCFGPPQQRYI